MKISTIICTRNRRGQLQKTLEGLRGVEVPEGCEFEVIVVDNGSTDGTSAMAAEFGSPWPLRAVVEERAGKSYALNTAVELARGDYFLFTDDDVLVEKDWVVRYKEAFEAYPDASIFAGLIRPEFDEQNPPSWLVTGFEVVANAYAVLDHGPDPLPLTMDRYPYGANMPMHRRVFDHFAFPVEIGPQPGSSIRGEEMVLVRELLKAGYTGWWIPNAAVWHVIPRSRQSTKYLRDYYLGTGELLSFLTSAEQTRRLFGRPRWAWREAVTCELRYQLGRRFRKSTTWLRDLRRASEAWGVLKGYSKG